VRIARAASVDSFFAVMFVCKPTCSSTYLLLHDVYSTCTLLRLVSSYIDVYDTRQIRGGALP
jgi:hypothetical protein